MPQATQGESPRQVSPAVIQEKPLTDPTDLITLLGRFAACAALFVLTFVLLIKGMYAMGAGIGIVSLFFQRATVKLWRRLRDERIAAEAERAIAGAVSDTDAPAAIAK